MSNSGFIVKQVDHIAVRSSDPRHLFSLLTDTFQLPIVWPMEYYGLALSGVVFAGNTGIEVFHYGPLQEGSQAETTWAKLYAIAFEPNIFPKSLSELSKRNIPHSPPIPFRGVRFDGFRGKLWTNVVVGGFLGRSSKIFNISKIIKGSSIMGRFIGYLIGELVTWSWAESLVIKSFGERALFLTEYTHDVSKTRSISLAELRNRSGGSLGVEAVHEIIIGVSGFDHKHRLWQNLLSPTLPTVPGLWYLGEGPAIRLIPHSEDDIQAIVLRVKSLEKAKIFLAQNNLLGKVSENQVSITPAKIQGLDIRLVE